MPESVNRQSVESALASLLDPETGRSVVQMEQLHDVDADGGKVSVTLGLTTWAAPLWEETRDEALRLLQSKLPAGTDVKVRVVEHHRPAEPIGQIGLTAKSVIAVGSGKGGVGKSTVAASIAYGLKNSGAKVGLMDADVYGPSIPHLLGVSERPTLVEGRLQPVTKDGLKVMSMGFLVPPGEAVVWRGPMLHGALRTFLHDVEWGELDYLLVDLPPGTGDVQLSLIQQTWVSGAVIVTTPSAVAIEDAVKAVDMFGKLQVPVLGVVENMSYFVCPNCDARHAIFDSGAAEARALAMGLPFLGAIPLHGDVRAGGDTGRPVVAEQPGSEYARALRDVAGRLAQRVSIQAHGVDAGPVGAAT
jgi:ATP-binding protein involved in chromosome partitioning